MQLDFAQRFVSRLVTLIDGTFNTNMLRLPLPVCVGITNTGSTFPICFSCCPSESEQSSRFNFQALKEECLVGSDKDSRDETMGILSHCILLSGQTAGLPPAIKNVMRDVQQQPCSWHIAQVIRGSFTDKFSQDSHNKAKIDEIYNLIWNYVEAASLIEPVEARATLISALDTRDHKYILMHYCSKERHLFAPTPGSFQT